MGDKSLGDTLDQQQRDIESYTIWWGNMIYYTGMCDDFKLESGESLRLSPENLRKIVYSSLDLMTRGHTVLAYAMNHYFWDDPKSLAWIINRMHLRGYLLATQCNLLYDIEGILSDGLCPDITAPDSELAEAIEKYAKAIIRDGELVLKALEAEKKRQSEA